MERQLAAILVADMAGYSRLMEQDEEGVLERQKRHRRELIDPEIARRGGHIVKTTGDGMLAEFASASSLEKRRDIKQIDYTTQVRPTPAPTPEHHNRLSTRYAEAGGRKSRRSPRPASAARLPQHSAVS